jgi:hypothetical protein
MTACRGRYNFTDSLLFMCRGMTLKESAEEILLLRCGMILSRPCQWLSYNAGTAFRFGISLAQMDRARMFPMQFA